MVLRPLIHGPHRLSMGAVLAIFIAFGCSRGGATASRENARSSSGSLVTLPSASASAAPAPTELRAPIGARSAQEASFVELVRQWNEAILSRNAQALDSVYASRVVFYARELNRAQTTSSKLSSLARAADYSQSIEALTFEGLTTELPLARFTKRWVANGKPGQVDAYLRFRREQGQWYVAEESDAPSAARRARQQSDYGNACQEAVIKLVLSTKEAQSYLMSRGPSSSYPPNSARFESFDWPKPRVALQENNEGYRVTIAWFEVDLTTQSVVEDTLGERGKSAPLVTLPQARVDVKMACKR